MEALRLMISELNTDDLQLTQDCDGGWRGGYRMKLMSRTGLPTGS